MAEQDIRIPGATPEIAGVAISPALETRVTASPNFWQRQGDRVKQAMTRWRGDYATHPDSAFAQHGPLKISDLGLPEHPRAEALARADELAREAVRHLSPEQLARLKAQEAEVDAIGRELHGVNPIAVEAAERPGLIQRGREQWAKWTAPKTLEQRLPKISALSEGPVDRNIVLRAVREGRLDIAPHLPFDGVKPGAEHLPTDLRHDWRRPGADSEWEAVKHLSENQGGMGRLTLHDAERMLQQPAIAPLAGEVQLPLNLQQPPARATFTRAELDARWNNVHAMRDARLAKLAAAPAVSAVEEVTLKAPRTTLPIIDGIRLRLGGGLGEPLAAPLAAPLEPLGNRLHLSEIPQPPKPAFFSKWPRESVASSAPIPPAPSTALALTDAPLVHHDVMGGPLRPANPPIVEEMAETAQRARLVDRVRAGLGKLAFWRKPAAAEAVASPVIAGEAIALPGPVSDNALVVAGELKHHDVLGQAQQAAAAEAPAAAAAQAAARQPRRGPIQWLKDTFRKGPSAAQVEQMDAQIKGYRDEAARLMESLPNAGKGGRTGLIIAGTVAAVGGAAYLTRPKHAQREQQRRFDAEAVADQGRA